LFGVASGLPDPLHLMGLHLLTEQRFCRPSFYAHTAERRTLLEIAANTFEYVRGGVFDVDIALRLPLRHAAEAHRAIEARLTAGAVVLMP
jgi:NADPH2:quinone reductase